MERSDLAGSRRHCAVLYKPPVMLISQNRIYASEATPRLAATGRGRRLESAAGQGGGRGNLVCPKCSGDETYRLSVVYKQGTAEIATRSTTVGVGVATGTAGGAGLAGTSTVGMQQTLLAKEAAPPARQTWA